MEEQLIKEAKAQYFKSASQMIAICNFKFIKNKHLQVPTSRHFTRIIDETT
jgi:hypothetical protein